MEILALVFIAAALEDSIRTGIRLKEEWITVKHAFRHGKGYMLKRTITTVILNLLLVGFMVNYLWQAR